MSPARTESRRKRTEEITVRFSFEATDSKVARRQMGRARRRMTASATKLEGRQMAYSVEELGLRTSLGALLPMS
jgi:hypothetical protein